MALVAAFQTLDSVQKSTQALTFAATTTSALSAPDAGSAQEQVLLGLSGSAKAATPSGDQIAMIGPVVVAQLAGSLAGLQDSNALTSENITQSASAVAQNIKAVISYQTYSVSDLHTKDDVSAAAMLQYRDDMRAALQPLLQNNQNELDLFGAYMESGDSSYLTQLSAAAKNYRAAAVSASALTVPKDAVYYHRDILNSLEEFAAVIGGLSSHPNDALASAGLLRSYDQAEQDVYNSFNALTRYYAQKTS
jgi:hypothetical protein